MKLFFRLTEACQKACFVFNLSSGSQRDSKNLNRLKYYYCHHPEPETLKMVDIDLISADKGESRAQGLSKAQTMLQ